MAGADEDFGLEVGRMWLFFMSRSNHETSAFLHFFCPNVRQGFLKNPVASRTIKMLNTCSSMARVGKQWPNSAKKPAQLSVYRLVKPLEHAGAWYTALKLLIYNSLSNWL
jgi:hypothetical protein